MVIVPQMKYVLKSKTPLYHGFFQVDCYTIEHERFDGGALLVEREHLERGQGVAVLLYDEQCDEVLLIEQFRIGAAVLNSNKQPWLIEVVAGMIDAGEDAEAAARRECLEEAGYAPESLRYLGEYYVTPGGSSEHITLYLGLVDKQKPVHDGGGVVSECEDIRRFWLPRQQAMTWLAQGKIDSGAPMLALMMAFGWQGVVSVPGGE